MASAPEHEASSLLPKEGEAEGTEPKKNFPPCYPLFYHDINCAIGTQAARTTARLAWYLWYVPSRSYEALCGMVILNAAAKMSILVKDHGFFTFIDVALSILYVLIIPLYSAWGYSFLYRGLRDWRTFPLMVFYCLYGVLACAMVIFCVGVSRSGGAGILGASSLFSSHHHVCAIIHLVSALAWFTVLAWTVGVFWSVRLRYKDIGGNDAASKEAQDVAAATAYANREEIASAAYRASTYNKEQPDPLAQAAWENREALATVAYENREAIARGAKVAATVAYENRQTIAAGARAASETVDTREILFEPPPPRPAKK